MQRSEYLERLTSPITKGKDGRWFTRVPDPTKGDGGRKMIRGATKEKVEAAVIEFFWDQDRRKRAANPTVKECWQRWYDFRKEHNRKLAQSSFQIYRQGYRRYFEGTDFEKMKVRDVTDRDVTDFLIDQIERHGLTTKPAQQLIFYVRSVFRRAYRDRIVTQDPCDFLDVQDEIMPACTEAGRRNAAEMVLSPEQAEAVTNVVVTHLARHPDYLPDLAILVAKYTGMRPAEIVALRWDDVRDGFIPLTRSEHRWHDDENGGQVYEIGETKTRKGRVVAICPELAEVFSRVRTIAEANGWDSPYVFYRRDGRYEGRITANALEKAMLRRGREAGIDGTVTVYRFRRTVESGLRAQGMSGETVGSMLGHTSQVGERFYAYDMATLSEKQKAVSRIYQVRKDSSAD